jgi:hypothetical protein
MFFFSSIIFFSLAFSLFFVYSLNHKCILLNFFCNIIQFKIDFIYFDDHSKNILKTYLFLRFLTSVACGHAASGGHRSHHLIVWFKVARKPGCTGFIRDFKGKRLFMAKECINTSIAPYLR